MEVRNEVTHSLVQNILNNGIQTNNRTGIDTLSIAGWNYKFDVGSEFPIAETKDVKIKNISGCYVDAKTRVGDTKVENKDRKSNIELIITNDIGDIKVN